MKLLSSKEIYSLIQYLRAQLPHSNFTINKMEVGSKTISAYELWLKGNGFADVVNYNWGGTNNCLMILTDKGRRLVKSKNYKWYVFKERLDVSMKYISFILSIIALGISLYNLLSYQNRI